MAKHEKKQPTQSMIGIKSGGEVSQQANVKTDQRMEDVQAEGDVFQKIIVDQQIDMVKLATELNTLRQALMNDVNNPAEQYPDIQHVHQAAIEAEKKEGSKALDYLSKVGKWAFDVATKIGTTVAAEAIKQSIGLGH